MKKHDIKIFIIIWVLLAGILSGCAYTESDNDTQDAVSPEYNSGDDESKEGESDESVPEENDSRDSVSDDSDPDAGEGTFDLEEVPDYQGRPYVVINNDQPFFTSKELETDSFERYSKLDDLGRCGVATACISKDIMPTEKRGAIGNVRPSGWHTVKYDFLPDRYLYNRCHLIGYQLSGENDNEKNLITGTRYMNVEGMLPFEDEVADYVRENDGRVLYRVTPEYEGDDLLASGVLMEASSLDSDDINFCVFCYNVQPDIEIDYEDGSSEAVGDGEVYSKESTEQTEHAEQTEPGTEKDASYSYVLNLNTKKFHKPDCGSVKDMKEKNTEYFDGTREEVIDKGFDPCGRCHP